MKQTTLALLLPLLMVFGGCSSPWYRLDGAGVEDADLQQALKTCRVARKLEGLERARDDRDDDLDQSTTNQQSMLIREEFSAIERQVYQEIDTCMYKQGYRRPG